MDTETLQAADFVRATPYAHQQEVFARSWNKQYWALFMEQGTGKTLVSLATAAAQQAKGKINALLVICADGLHYNWAREIEKYGKFQEPTVALWDSSMGKRALGSWVHTATSEDVHFPILLVNIEALRLERFRDTLHTLLQNRRVMTILDESTCIANPKASQSKEAFKLGLQSVATRILSGTPIRKNLQDLWAQCHFLSPAALPYPSYVAFCATFTIQRTMTLGQRSFQQLVGFQNQELLRTQLSEFSSRVEKKDCLDLPPKIYSTIDVPLTDEQMRQYKLLQEQCMLDLPSGPLLIPQVLPKIIKFQQLVSGWVNDAEGKTHAIRSNRLRALMDHVQRDPRPSIIFCAFIEDIRVVSEELRAAGHTCCVYEGATTAEERRTAVDGFMDGRFDYFVATRAASKGLTLTRAEAVIYYSQGWSLETRLQSEDRAHRIGLLHPVNYITLCSPGTIDEKIARALHNKKELADEIVSASALNAAVALSEPLFLS